MGNALNKIISLLIYLIPASILYAGAPFITNDPVPATFRGTDIYLFSNLNKTNIVIEEPYLNLAAVEADWGFLPDFQVSIVIPYAWANTSIHASHGWGDIQLGITYRFVEETPQLPHIALAPQMTLPTGDVDDNLGNGQISFQLPIWFQKSWGPWTSYGGGGWAFNAAPGQRNYPFAGWLLQKDLSKALTFGLEIFSEGAVSDTGRASTAINAGGNYNVTEQFSLLFSAGHSIIGQQRVLGYIGILWSIS